MNIPKLCTTCHMHYLDKACPHCNTESPSNQVKRTIRPSLPIALLLGLGLSACPAKDEDTSIDDTNTTEEPTPEPSDAALYGVPSE